MVRSAFLLSAAAAATVPAAFAGPVAANQRFSLSVKKAVPQTDPANLTISSHVLRLQKSTMHSKSSAYLKDIAAGPDQDGFFNFGWGYGATHLHNTLDVEYTTTIEWADTAVDVIVDTGSSDTWLVHKGFQCVTIKGKPQPESQCDFGPVFNGSFQDGKIPDVNFNIEYGDLEFAVGEMGHEDVTVAGLTAYGQTVALVEIAYWQGDGVTSGLMGLAYPALTSEFSGTNYSADSINDTIEYDPIFTTLYKQGQIAPLFSLALERNSGGGYLALGGLPPVLPSGGFASTPILITQGSDVTRIETQRSYYTIEVDGYFMGTGDKLEQMSAGADSTAILDSGTTLALLPSRVVDQLAANFDPPATYNDYFGALGVACNATAPDFGVQIGGKVFKVSPKDLIYNTPDLIDPTTGQCLVGVYNNGGGLNILGDTFLNNVIAVFDVGAAEILLAPHEY